MLQIGEKNQLSLVRLELKWYRSKFKLVFGRKQKSDRRINNPSSYLTGMSEECFWYGTCYIIEVNRKRN